MNQNSPRTKTNGRWEKWRWFTAVRLVVIALALVGVVSGILSYFLAHDGVFSWKSLAQDYGANLSTTLIGFAVAVLVIDVLNERRMNQERKQAIVQQMRSPVLEAALEAVRIARIEGWIEDGSLDGVGLLHANLEDADLNHANLNRANFTGANLKSATLYRANLVEAHLWFAKLERANLGFANMQGADMMSANLRDASCFNANLQAANLKGADLRGTNLEFANLRNAELGKVQGHTLGEQPNALNFEDARCDENTTLPDGKQWTPGTDMNRFTDPIHADFFQPDWDAFGRDVEQHTEESNQ